MNNRPRLIYKLIQDESVVKVQINERVYLIRGADGNFYIDGCLKKYQKKTPSFRKGVKHYATKHR